MTITQLADAHPRADYDYLQAELRRALITVTAVAAAILVVIQVVSDSARQPVTALPITVLLTCATLAWRAGSRWPRLGVGTLIGGHTVALVSVLLIYPGTPFIYAFVLVAVSATLLGGLPGGSLATIVVSATVIILSSGSATVVAARDVYPVISLSAAGALIAWLGTRPTETAVRWAWHSYDDSVRKMTEARERQAELGRVSKSLEEAYTRLEYLNRELDRARQAAEEARRLKTEFATTISHELRTPLNLIIGFAEMMVQAPHSYQGESLPASYRGDIEAIYRNACHLSDLLDDVLDLSQVDAHRLALEKEDISLAHVVQEATATVDGLYRELGLSLTVDLPPDLPTLYADRTRVRQILINLLTNATRFTDTGGVTIRASCDGHEVVVAVADTGCGIPPDDLPQLFREFAQGATSRQHRGSGLGLAVSKRFAELHGGTMWAESTPGLGSTFFFTLPLIRNVVPKVAERDWRAYVRDSDHPDERVALVVGHDDDAVALFRRYLDGCRVIGPLGLDQVRRFVARCTVSIVIITNAMADNQDAHAIAAAVAPVPVISCILTTPERRRAELGVAAYLIKPLTRARLREALRRVAPKARRILVVEDDTDFSNLLRRMIASVLPHCCIRRASDGAEALRLMREDSPDLVLLDLLLPHVDGYTVLREMRADVMLRSTPVVVLTGQERSDSTVVAPDITVMRTGGFTAGEVMHLVKQVLSLPRQLAPAFGGDSSGSLA